MSDTASRRRRPEHRRASYSDDVPLRPLPELNDVEDADFEELGGNLPVPYKARDAWATAPVGTPPEASDVSQALRAPAPSDADLPEEIDEVAFDDPAGLAPDLPAAAEREVVLPEEQPGNEPLVGGEEASLEPAIAEQGPGAGPGEVSLVAKQAYLAGPNVLSLINPQLKDEVDELDGLWSAMSEFAAGDFVAYELDLRAYDSRAFSAAAKAHVQELKGQKPDAGTGWGGRLTTAAEALTWLLGRLLWDPKGRTPAPWKREKAKAIQPGQMDQGTKRELADAELKAAEDTHFEAVARLYAGGAPERSYEQRMHVETMTSKFNHFRTGHQWLDWQDTNALGALHGVMPVRAKEPMVLSAPEVAEVWRVPDDLTKAHGVSLDRSNIEWLEPAQPVVIKKPLDPEKGRIPLGLINVHSDAAQCIGLWNSQLDQHGLLVGRTGTGKSETAQWLVFGMVKADYPVIVVDPHGALHDALVRNLLIHAPEHAHRIISVDLSDEEYPVALNPLDVPSRRAIEARVAEIMEMLGSQMQLSAGNAPRALNYAQLALTALCEANLVLRERPDTPLCTLLHLTRFYTSTEFRRLVCEFSENPGVHSAFDPETGSFEQLTEKVQAEHVAPLMRAFQPFETSQLFANTLGASQNKLDWTRLMRENRVVVVKLARMSHQKKLGEFVGRLILPMVRGSMDEWGRKKDPRTGQTHGRGCRIVVDEAPTLIASDGVAESLLSEARKWDVSILLISQFLLQYEETGGPSLVRALLNNTATKVVLRQPPASAAALASDMGGVEKDAIAELPRFHAIADTPGADGKASDAFTVQLLLPLDQTEPLAPVSDDERERLYDAVVARSRQELTNPADEMRRDVLAAPERITTALGLALNERTHAPLSSSFAPSAPAPSAGGTPDASDAARRATDPASPISPPPRSDAASAIPGTPEAWEFGAYDEFDLELDG